MRVLGPEQPETAETKYDLACLLALRGETDEALSLLGQAIDPRIDLKIENDPDFASLHTDPRFATLVAHAKKQASLQSPISPAPKGDAFGPRTCLLPTYMERR